MNALRRISPLSANIAALSLGGVELDAATAGSAPNGPLKIDAMMKQWEYEDRLKTEYTIRVPASIDRVDIFKYGRLTWAEPIPMTSGKNVSPKRVEKRRRKKKLARSQRRRNRRQNAKSDAPT